MQHTPTGLSACFGHLEQGINVERPLGVPLTVVGAISNERTCSFSSIGTSFEGFFTAWQLEDEAGERWILAFRVGGISEAILSPGQRVVVRERGVSLVHGGARGFLSVEEEGAPVLFVANGAVPEFPDVPDFHIELGEVECGGPCWSHNEARITANGETVALASGDSIELGELHVTSAGTRDGRPCPESDGDIRWSAMLREEFLVGGYRVP